MADELEKKAWKIYQALGEAVHLLEVDKHTFLNTCQPIQQLLFFCEIYSGGMVSSTSHKASLRSGTLRLIVHVIKLSISILFSFSKTFLFFLHIKQNI